MKKTWRINVQKLRNERLKSSFEEKLNGKLRNFGTVQYEFKLMLRHRKSELIEAAIEACHTVRKVIERGAASWWNEPLRRMVKTMKSLKEAEGKECQM